MSHKDRTKSTTKDHRIIIGVSEGRAYMIENPFNDVVEVRVYDVEKVPRNAKHVCKDKDGDHYVRIIL